MKSSLFCFLTLERRKKNPLPKMPPLLGGRSRRNGPGREILERSYGGTRADPSTCSSYLRLFSFSIFVFVLFCFFEMPHILPSPVDRKGAQRRERFRPFGIVNWLFVLSFSFWGEAKGGDWENKKNRTDSHRHSSLSSPDPISIYESM